MTLLLTWLVSNGLLALPLMGLAWLASRRWPQRPALAHGLWLLVFLKLLTPPLFNLTLPKWPAAASVSVRQEPAPPALPRPASDEAPTPKAPAEIASCFGEDEIESAALNASPSTIFSEPAAVALADVPAPAAAPAVVPSAPIDWASFLVPALFGAWLLGMACWLALIAWRLTKFQRLLAHAEPAAPGTQRLADQLAGRFGLDRAPPVKLLPGNFAPMLWSLGGRTLILLPKALLAQVSQGSLATLLLHELAHWRRGDHLVRFLELAALAVYWWHPGVWFARLKLREAEEECCDAWVATLAPGGRATYAQAMLATVDFLAATSQPLPVAGSGLSHFQHLRRRLTMLKSEKLARSLRWPGRLGLLGLALLALPLGASLASGAKDDEANQPPPEDRRGGGRGAAAGRGDEPPPPPIRESQPRSGGRGRGPGGGPGGPDGGDGPPGDPERRRGPGGEGRGPGAPPPGGMPGGMGMMIPPDRPISEEEKAELLFEARSELRLMKVQLRYKEEEIGAAQEKVEQAMARFGRLRQQQEGGRITAEEVEQGKFAVANAEREVRLTKLRMDEARERLAIAEERVKLIEEGKLRTRRPMAGGFGGMAPMGGATAPMAGGMGAMPGGGPGFGGAAAGGPGGQFGGGRGGPGGPGGRGGPAGGRGGAAPAAPGEGGGPPPGGAGAAGAPARAADGNANEEVIRLRRELERLRREVEKAKKDGGDGVPAKP